MYTKRRLSLSLCRVSGLLKGPPHKAHSVGMSHRM